MPEGSGSQDRRTLRLLAGVAVLVPFLTLFLSILPIGEGLEKTAYDMWFGIRGGIPRPEEVVVIKIDVDSEQILGRYPWRRTWHAKLIRNLARAGVKVVAFDATFGDAAPDPSDDEDLKAAIDSTGIVILGAKTLGVNTGAAVMRSLEPPKGVLSDAPIGIVDNAPDPVDGVIRIYPVLHGYRQFDGSTRLVPQLGLQAVRMYLGEDLDEPVQTYPGGWIVGEIRIPRAPGGGMLIDYLGVTESVTMYSYADIVDDAETDVGEWDLDAFEDLLAEGRLKDKIVFVGSTVPEHQDLWTTPFKSDPATGNAVLTPGVEIHANAVDTILKRRFIHTAPWWLDYLLVLLLAIGTVWLTSRFKARWGGVTGLALIAVVVVAGALLFVTMRYWVWTVIPALTVLLAYSGSTVVLYLVEQQEKARIRGMFQQYVPTRVVTELMAHPELLTLGGEERELTVLFSDVAGFTSISENLSPTELVSILNEYLTVMTEVVLKYEGIIDKYEGDALMAEFGAPIPFPDHALRACKAALEMQTQLAGLRERWHEEGRPELQARVGLNTGIMLVGNLGSRHIMDYTVMGDNVNLASRLEGANKVYGSTICISEMTYDQVAAEIFCRELDLIRVKGKLRPVRIFEVLGTIDQGVPAGRQSMIERYEMALQFFRDRQFEQALEYFREIHELDPDDGPTRLYIKRSEAYLETPPPPEWDGVFVMTTK